MEIENKLKPKKYEIIKLKFAIIGDKGSGKTTFINTFKENNNSMQDNHIKEIKGTLVLDKNKVNRVFDVSFAEIDDIDRNIDSLRKVHCIFIASNLDKKENYDSVIKVLRLFLEKRIEVNITLLGNVLTSKTTYFDDLDLIKNDYQEVISDFNKDLKVNDFFPLKFNNKEEINEVIAKVISKLELKIKKENLGDGHSCVIF